MTGFSIIITSIAFLGNLISGIWDIKTTEIPDEIPTLMAFIGLASWFIYGSITQNFIPLLTCIITGSILLVFGWFLYKKGQWGGGDAKLLAGTAYMIPFTDFGLFAFDFTLNVFMIGAVYMIIYALLYGLIKRKIYVDTYKDIRSKGKIAIKMIIGFGILELALASFLILQGINNIAFAFYTWILLSFLVLFWRYGIQLEKSMKKTITLSEVKEGDVLQTFQKWDGIKPREIKELIKEHGANKKVTVKEGIRFGPAFVFAFIATFYIGNVVFFLF